MKYSAMQTRCKVISTGTALERQVADGQPANSSTDEFEAGSGYSLDEFDVDHAGFEDSAGDFTKHYNRLRQHVDVSTHRDSAKALPASNRVTRVPKAAEGKASRTTVHTNKVKASLATLGPQLSAYLNLDPMSRGSQTRKGGREAYNVGKDKSDRATSEQVLDDRTRLILLKMLNRHLLSRIDGCVSTGKESNVYHAVGPVDVDRFEASAERHLALKVYKTSILVFKDRDRYVTGEFRFRTGYARSNPRKMVRLWAEKELRNLRRLESANIPCPKAIEVRNNVLVMEFLGLDADRWQPSPRLKDAFIPDARVDSLYIELLYIICLLYHRCKLIHADLSEYNILFHHNTPFIIDVSQSVEHDHPHAFDFLRSDLTNLHSFFKQRGMCTPSLQEAFDIVSSQAFFAAHLAGTSIEAHTALQAEVDRLRSHTDVEDAAFKNSYIPRSLNEVYDAERDVDLIISGKGNSLIYAKHTGVAEVTRSIPYGASVESSDDGSLGRTSRESSRTAETCTRGKFDNRDANKDRKQAIREARRTNRLTKMPKKMKAKQIKKTSSKR